MIENGDIHEIEKIIRQARAERGRGRVLAIEWRGRRCWLKQTGGQNDSNFLNRIHRLSSPVLPDILRNVNEPDQLKSLKAEAARLRDWNGQNLPAPLLLAEGDDWIVISDGGTQLADVIRASDRNKAFMLISSALDTLLTAHRANNAHGRPMVKDMAIDENGKITLLDFEEQTIPAIPVPAAQARDLWIFLASVTRYLDRSMIDELTATALGKSRPETVAEMKKSVKILKPVKSMLQWLGPKKLGREISGAFMLVESLEKELVRYE